MVGFYFPEIFRVSGKCPGFVSKAICRLLREKKINTENLELEVTAFRASSARGRAALSREIGFGVELQDQGNRYSLEVFKLGPG